MQCVKCRNKAVFFQSYSGRHLCSRHLVLDIEARAKRTIRSHHWMRPGDHIAVVVSGNCKSAALLYFLHKLTADRRDIRLCAVLFGGADNGTYNRSAIGTIAESLGIPVIKTLPADMPVPAGPDTITKIALAISLDDIAEGVLQQFLFGNVDRLVHSPRDPGCPIPVICPFIMIPSDEVNIYGETEGPGMSLPPGIRDNAAVPQEIRNLLYTFSRRHPSTKYALLHLAEELSDGNAGPIAAAGPGPGGPGSPGFASEVHDRGN